jgi:hypothetical protein
MPKRVKQGRKRQSRDVNQAAHELVRRSTEEREQAATTERSVISEYMSALGKKGGQASGKRRMINYSPEQRSEIAHKAALARWEKAKEKK